MFRICLTVIAVLALIPTAFADTIDNPEYTHWKNFKAGTTVVRAGVTKAAGNETKMTMTTVLKSISDEKAVVSMQTTIVVAGREIKQPAQDRDVPAKMEKPKVDETQPKPDMKTEKGEETIEAAGTKYECKWVKTTIVKDGTTVVTTVWTNDKVPGQLVKMASKMTSSAYSTDTTQTLVKLDVK